MPLITATGVIALLSDDEVELQVFALQTLNEDIDTVWFEVAPVVTLMYVQNSPPAGKGIGIEIFADILCVRSLCSQ